MVEIVNQAAEQLRITASGKPLVEVATECMQMLGVYKQRAWIAAHRRQRRQRARQLAPLVVGVLAACAVVVAVRRR